jgi:hypothetical protein
MSGQEASLPLTESVYQAAAHRQPPLDAFRSSAAQ